MSQIIDLEVNSDERGLLFEILRQDKIQHEIKQVYFSISKKGAVRGNHYHKRKIEWFSVIKGTGKIILKNKRTNKEHISILNGNKPAIVKIEPYISHAIQNIGKEDMYLIVIVNEIFDIKDPDTYHETIW